LDKKALEVVKRFVKRVGKDFKLEAVIFFGSRARGDYLLHSDVDVILISPDFEGIGFTERMSRMYGYWNYEYPFEVLCYTPREFKKKKKQIGIVRQALREGIRVV
jgi:hypothetical protein